MRLAVLGPLALEGPEGTVAVPGGKARELLTVLALSAPEPVSLDRLIDVLWRDPPPAAVKVVQAHASRLRRALADAGAPGVLGRAGAGYRLDLGERLDAVAQAEVRRQAMVTRDDGDFGAAAELFGRARALWRGAPELPATPAGEAILQRLRDERLELVIAHLACLIETAAPDRALPELAELVAAEPLNERLWELRILALYRSGRPTEALRAHRRVTALLAEEIGVSPGPALSGLEAAILAHDVGPGPVAPATGPVRPVDAVRAAGDPAVHFTPSGAGHIAYRSFGDGDTPVLLLTPGLLSIDALFDEPRLAAALARLGTGRRVVAFDPRGIGLSDRTQPPDTINIDDWVDDACAVLDASQLGPAHLFAPAHGGLVALTLAACHPDRVRSVTLLNAFARSRIDTDYPHGADPAMDATLRSTLRPGAAGRGPDALTLIVPSMAGDPDFRAWWDRAGRRAAGPAAAETLLDMVTRADVRGLLPRVQAQALVLIGRGCPVYDPGHGDYLARHLPDATVVSRHAIDDAWWIGDPDGVLDAFDRFLAAMPGPAISS